MQKTRPGWLISVVWPPLVAVAAASTAPLWVALLALNAPLRAPREAALLLVYLLLYHLALLALPALGAAFALSRLGTTENGEGTGRARVTVGWTLVALVIALNAGLRFTLSYAPFRGALPLFTPLGTLTLLVFVATPFVIFHALRSRPGRPRRFRAWLAGWLVILGAVMGVNLWHEKPPKFPIAELRVPDAPAPAAGRPARVALLGFDGIAWPVIDRMLADGRMPATERLLAGSARANLQSAIPTTSSILWNTIATGRTGEDHGILGFIHFRLPGMRAELRTGPYWKSRNWWNGLNRALSILGSRGLIEQRAFFSSDRLEPTIWDVATHHGHSIGATGWFSSWPAPDLPAGSYMVSSYGPCPRSRVPETDVERVLEAHTPLPIPPETLTPRPDAWLDGFTREQHGRFYQALALREHFRPELSVGYWHFLDSIQHRYWWGEAGAKFTSSHEEGYSPRVRNGYALLDRWIESFVEQLEPDTLLLIVSDHGYDPDGHEHHHAPDGLLIAAGPGVRPGPVADGATLYDVAPTVLAALGLPVSEELPGRVLDELFVPGALPAARSVSSYDWYEPPPAREYCDLEQERQRIEELRALGYLN